MTKKFNRREFLEATGLLLVSGKLVYDTLMDYNKSETRKDIYQLGNYVYIADYETIDKNGFKRKSKGCGVCLDDYFLTVDHIPGAPEKIRMMTPFGLMETDIEIKEKRAKLEGLEMEELVRNQEKDIAIYYIGKDKYESKGLKEFPCKPSSKRNLGNRVYIIGNPHLGGANIRETTISDLDGMDLDNEIVKVTKYGFGIAKQLIPGDSGTPTVNEDYKLIGINNIGVIGGVGYAVKIEEFLKELKDVQKNRRKIN